MTGGGLSGPPRRTLAGVETLLSAGAPPFPGERLGLLTHPAAILSDGRHAAAALLAAGADLRVLFGPEHGLHGTAPAGSSEPGHSRDPDTGLPVLDLYPHSPARVARALTTAGTDLLLVDLQHAGARFFTYEAALHDALAAARTAGVRVCVLDRPNPLGDAVRGPSLGPTTRSILGRIALPITHGLTMGELARLFAHRLGLAAPEVVPLQHADPTAPFAATGLPWAPPSPNLPSAETALLYPGTCLFEGTNLSVGRGTTLPFAFVGAPWLDGGLADHLRGLALPGVVFRTARVTPAHDRWAGQAVTGVQWHVTDPASLDPVAAAVTVLSALRARHPDAFAFDAPHFDLLLGSSATRQAIESGAAPAAVVASWATDEAAFRDHERRPHLLYPGRQEVTTP